MDFELILIELNKNRIMTTYDETIAFDNALGQLPESISQDDLRSLLLVFDDNCEHIEVMWGLIHAVEVYDDQSLVVAYLETVQSMVQNADSWALLIMGRLLNNESCRNILAEQLSIAEEPAKTVAISILDRILAEGKRMLPSHALLVLNTVKGV